MSEFDSILIGKGETEARLLAKFGNRHGLIAGATGTGKTVTLQRIAEGFARMGVPVFLADVKGDLSGMSMIGGGKEVFEKRAADLGLTNWTHEANPTIFWDLFGQQGHPIRATISELGPVLLSRLLDLNDVQEGVLNIAFKVADDNGLLLLDLKDLRSMLAYITENAAELTANYGNVSGATVGAIQRQLLVLEQQGAEHFFGEPALDFSDFMRTTIDGRGLVNILAADILMRSPRLYATFLLWMLSELFENLPEVGDAPKPKLAFFFDEAHLLFNDAPPALLEKIEQVVRLIRSKGVGVYFITQNPIDIPDTVLGQLGNRVQHALRAFTPRDQKAVRSAAETFRPNPNFSTEEVITQLAVGEALVSTLDEKGTPNIVDRVLIAPPVSRIGPATPDERTTVIGQSPVRGKYDTAVDRESAYEVLHARAVQATQEQERMEAEQAQQKAEAREERAPARRSDSVFESMAKSVARAAGSQLGRNLVRGILGGLLGGSTSRRRR
ncbi:MAG: DUF853 family protein [Chthonomonas sp.]|nr:DUF853 family protein [Chthonomonas sp.]